MATERYLDERRRRGKAGVEAILNRAVGDGDGQVGLAGATGPAGDQAVAVGDQLGTEDAAEQGQADTALEGKVEFLDRFEEGKVGTPDAALDASLGAMRDFLCHEHREDVTGAEAVGFGPLYELWIEAAHSWQVQPPEQRIEIDRRRHGAHHRASDALPRGIAR